MEQPTKVTKRSLYDASSQLSKWAFYWMIPLFMYGYKRDLQLSDLDECSKRDEPVVVTSMLEREWEKELRKRKLYGKEPSLISAIFRAFGFRYFLANSVIVIGEIVIRLTQPFLVGAVVRYLLQTSDRKEISDSDAIGYAVGLVISCFIYCTSKHRTGVMMVQVGNNVRTALSVMMFKKMMKLSTTSMNQTDIGQIINIMANDMTRFEDLAWFGAFFFLGPVMCIIVVYFTCLYLNWAACIAGVGMLVFFIAFQAGMGWLFGKYRMQTTQITDERVNRMSELISAMKIIKLYCWEAPFAGVVHEIRLREIKTLKSTCYLKGINSSFFFVGNRMMIYAAFIVYVLMKNDLKSEEVFVIMSLYDAIKLPVTAFFPNAIGNGAESLVTCDRIQKILLLEDRDVSRKDMSSGEKGSIHFKSYSAKWTKSSVRENLSNITLDIKPGELVVVVGSVGSGKTCFLYSLLDEVEKISGNYEISGRTSYAPQSSWCFGGSVKENILLSNPHDMVKLDKVIHVCGLERDLQLFPDGENTFVGEKGYSLSGGQKARISLARAVYHESDIYLLDDPLSAVDPKVANHIFSKCIKGYLQKKGKTVILVTHQLQFLKQADKVLVLNEGKMVAFGSYAELVSSSFDLLAYLKAGDSEKEGQKDVKSVSFKTQLSKTQSFTGSSVEETISELPYEDAVPQSRQKSDEQTSCAKFDSRIYWRYLKASRKPVLLIFGMFLYIASQGLYQFTDFWVAAWTQKSFVNVTKALAAEAVVDGEENNVIIYSVLIVLLFIFSFIRTFVTYLICLSSSINIHNNVFKSLLRAPMSFFESNPLGRILNRVTRDIGIVDQIVPTTFSDLVSIFLNVLGVLILSMVVNPYLIIPCVVLAAVTVPIRNIYVSTARDLQRLDAIARSPVYDHVGTAFSGLAALRAFGVEENFERQFYRFMRDSVSCRFLVLSGQRGVGFLLDMISNIYILSITAAVMAVSRDKIAGGDAGLLLSSSLQILGYFQYGIRLSCDFETQMVSCERVMEYENIPPEAPLEIEDKKPDHQWPITGEIEFDDVSLRYSCDQPPVLHDVSLRVRAEEKIGIVGRTGAGKSSLLSVLFRLVEPEGKILIDGIDIGTLGLHDVRNKISIIPQDPVLFSGSIRQNLDPFGKFASDQIWEALEAANLDVAVKSMAGSLEASVTEGGSNLSVGQRQLLCLARALLRKNKILVCDEATANVDHETDELIRKTIKTKFSHCTLITVAHRLNTIIDMDKVLVLDAGRVVQFDEPYVLLKDADGLFYSMVKETGPELSKMLHREAEASFFQKHGSIDTGL